MVYEIPEDKQGVLAFCCQCEEVTQQRVRGISLTYMASGKLTAHLEVACNQCGRSGFLAVATYPTEGATVAEINLPKEVG